MVRQRPRKFGHLPACARVHCQDRRNVAVELRLHYRSFLIDHPDPAYPNSICQPTALNNAVLASALEANPSAAVLHETKKATKMDCHEVFRHLCRGRRFLSCIDCFACTVPGCHYLQLHSVQDYLTIYHHFALHLYTLLAAWFRPLQQLSRVLRVTP